MRSRLLFALGIALAGVVVLPSSGSAASGPPAAEVVFANGGRIVSVKADGSGRKVLTRKAGPVVAERSWDAFVPVEDSKPSVSPDGESLLFQRKFDTKRGGWRTELIVANRDGTGQKAIVKLKTPVITWLGWTPDNRVALNTWDYQLDRKGERTTFRILSFDRSGADRKVLLFRQYKSTDFKNHDRYESSHLALAAFSPEGRMLYAVGDLRQTFLRERDLETGEDRLLLKGVDQGTYSPDGSRLAVTPTSCQNTREEKPRVCDGWKYGLWTANLDGTDRKRILGRGTGVLEPRFSPDGERILFTSSRNSPGAHDKALEVYSVGTDGSCLAWLTNGSPASEDARWAPEPADSRPASCGTNGLKPLVEVTPRKVRQAPHPRLWAGPEVRGRLLTSTNADRNYESYYYEDCAYFNRSKCRESIMLESIPTCNPGNMGQSVNMAPGRMIPSIQRGAWMNTMKSGKSVSGLLLTGRVQLTFGDSWFINSGGIPTNGKDLAYIVRNLRPVGAPADANAALPGPTAPKGTNRRLNRIYRLYRQTGSITQTARRAKTTRQEVRWLIRWKSVINKVTPFKEIKCHG